MPYNTCLHTCMWILCFPSHLRDVCPQLLCKDLCFPLFLLLEFQKRMWSYSTVPLMNKKDKYMIDLPRVALCHCKLCACFQVVWAEDIPSASIVYRQVPIWFCVNGRVVVLLTLKDVLYCVLSPVLRNASLLRVKMPAFIYHAFLFL